MSTPNAKSVSDQLFAEAMAAAEARLRGPKHAKTSSAAPAAAPEDSARVKLSEFAEDAWRVGELLHEVGTRGIENLAFRKVSKSGGGQMPRTNPDSPNNQPSLRSPSSLPDAPNPAPEDSKRGVQTYSDDVSDTSSPGTVSDRGGDAPDKEPAVNKKGQVPEVVPGKGATTDKNTGPTVSMKSSSDPRALAHFFQTISGGKFSSAGTMEDKVAYLHSLGRPTLDSVADVFVKTAARYQRDPVTLWRDLADLPSPDKTAVLREFCMQHGRYKTSGDLDSDISKAKKAVEGIVKATGELPEAGEISEAAAVHPTAANLAIYEVAELIAAVGGEVASAAAPMGDGGPAPEAAGVPAPPAGAMPGAPMGGDPMGGGAPPMGPPPGGDPMGGGAPPMGPPPGGDPGMVAQASAGAKKQASNADLNELIQDICRRKLSADSELSGNREEPADPSNLSPEDLAEDPEPSKGKAGKKELTLSAEDRAKLDRTIGSIPALTKSDPSDVAGDQEPQPGMLETSTSNPGTKGLLATKEPVKGTQEGDYHSKDTKAATPDGGKDLSGVVSGQKTSGDLMARLVAQSEDWDHFEKQSKDVQRDDSGRFVSPKSKSGPVDKLPEGKYRTPKRDKTEPEETAEKEKEKHTKGSTALQELARGLFPKASSEAVTAATPSGGDSDNIEASVRNALDFIEKRSKEKHRTPSVQDIVDEAGVTLDDATKALSLFTEG